MPGCVVCNCSSPHAAEVPSRHHSANPERERPLVVPTRSHRASPVLLPQHAAAASRCPDTGAGVRAAPGSLRDVCAAIGAALDASTAALCDAFACQSPATDSSSLMGTCADRKAPPVGPRTPHAAPQTQTGWCGGLDFTSEGDWRSSERPGGLAPCTPPCAPPAPPPLDARHLRSAHQLRAHGLSQAFDATSPERRTLTPCSGCDEDPGGVSPLGGWPCNGHEPPYSSSAGYGPFCRLTPQPSHLVRHAELERLTWW